MVKANLIRIYALMALYAMVFYLIGGIGASAAVLKGTKVTENIEIFRNNSGMEYQEDTDGRYLRIPANTPISLGEVTEYNISIEFNLKINHQTIPAYYLRIIPVSNSSESIRYDISQAYGTVPYYNGKKGAPNTNEKPNTNLVQKVIVSISSVDGLTFKTSCTINGQKSSQNLTFNTKPDTLGTFNFMPDAVTTINLYSVKVISENNYELSLTNSIGEPIQEASELPANTDVKISCNTGKYNSNGDIMVCALYQENKMIDVDIIPIIFGDENEKQSFTAALTTPADSHNCHIYTYIWSGIKSSRALTNYAIFGN